MVTMQEEEEEEEREDYDMGIYWVNYELVIKEFLEGFFSWAMFSRHKYPLLGLSKSPFLICDLYIMMAPRFLIMKVLFWCFEDQLSSLVVK